MTGRSVLSRVHGFHGVVVVSGHLTDAPDRPVARFPERCVDTVTGEVAAHLDRWGLDEHWLVVCGGARGGDLIAARLARERDATVWVLLAHEPDRFVESSVAGAARHWIDDFWGLLARTPSWTFDTTDPRSDTDRVYQATNEWMLEVARRQAAGGPLRLVAVWDGEDAGGEGGTADMVAVAGDAGAEIAVVSPKP